MLTHIYACVIIVNIITLSLSFWLVQFVGSEDVMDNTGSKIAQAAIGRIRVSSYMYTNSMQ